MGGTTSRHRFLEQAEGARPEDSEAANACPCCGEPLTLDDRGAARCACCGYPETVAGWLDYDGC